MALACASPLAAAPTLAKSPAKPREHADLFGGYSFVRAGAAHLNGWNVSASYPSWRSLRLVGDLSGHYGSFAGADLSQIQLMVGARRHWHFHGVSPFAELLVGGVRHKASIVAADTTLSASGTDLGVSPGLGADYRFTRAWAARAAFDLLLVRAGGWDTDPRLSIGAVYRFGAR